MKKSIRSFDGKIRKFNRDQRGMEALQSVMILAIAAVVVTGAFTVAKYAVKYGAGSVTSVTGQVTGTQANTMGSMKTISTNLDENGQDSTAKGSAKQSSSLFN